MDEKKQKKTKSRHTEELESKITDLEEQLKRAVADYRNLENRNREEKLEFIKFANRALLEQLLPAFDTLFLAEKHTEDQNVKLTVRHIIEVLKSAGIEKVETIGQNYNPTTMEVVEVVEGARDEVIEETQPGFSLNGKVIRPARVKVGRGTVDERVASSSEEEKKLNA